MSKSILYCRISSIDQKLDRQKISEKNFDIVIEDKISGSIPFFLRPGGVEIKKLVEHKIIKSLSVWTIDRLGRNLLDILSTIEFFTKQGIIIHFISQGLVTMDDSGKENPISKLIISILGIVSEMERTQSKERQLEGIYLAKMKGDVYTGRKPGTKEDSLSFLTKPKNKKALEFLKKGDLTGVEIGKLLDLNVNTITKIKKLGLATIN